MDLERSMFRGEHSFHVAQALCSQVSISVLLEQKFVVNNFFSTWESSASRLTIVPGLAWKRHYPFCDILACVSHRSHPLSLCRALLMLSLTVVEPHLPDMLVDEWWWWTPCSCSLLLSTTHRSVVVRWKTKQRKPQPRQHRVRQAVVVGQLKVCNPLRIEWRFVGYHCNGLAMLLSNWGEHCWNIFRVPQQFVF